MRNKLLFFMAIIMTLLALIPVAAQDDEEFIFGMVLVGPRDDRGWSQAHYEGGLYVEERIPGARMLYFESLNPSDTPETTLMDVVSLFVDEGAQVIFTTSDAFEEDTNAVAREFPDVVFINVSGDDVLVGTAPPNLGNVMAQIEIPRLIAGCAAALTTQTGKIGYLGPLINAETRRVSSSAYLGARYCYENYAGGNAEDLEFKVVWIGFWFPIPGVTLDATEQSNAFFDDGFDVVMSGIDTAEMVIVAGQRQEEGENVYAIPYNSLEGCNQAPEACLGVPYYNWGVAYKSIIEEVQAGTWESRWDWVAPDYEDMNNLETSITGFAVGEGLSEENAELLEEFIAELVAYQTENEDSFFLWQGPLNLQDGTVLAEEGETVPLEDIWYLPQLLEGMDGDSE
ncbi:MAG: BMP family ABC transporter substrate-binding protein [Phototrophicales bacterium]